MSHTLKEPRQVIGSSNDNFYLFSNDKYPDDLYVDFFVQDANKNITITIKDLANEGYTIELNGKPDNVINQRNFNTKGTVTQVIYSLMECLKTYPTVFYDIEKIDNSLRVHISSTSTYFIESSDIDFIIVGGNYMKGGQAHSNKFVMNGKYDDNLITLEKTVTTKTVSFNVSSIFHYMSFKYPKMLYLNSYSVYNNECEPIVLKNKELCVLPTSITKFESIDYQQYYFHKANRSKRVKFLTSNLSRRTDYDEVIAFSLLTDEPDITIVKKYYTNGGNFIASKNGVRNIEYTNFRMDFYDIMDIRQIESEYETEVGFVEYYALNQSDVIITEPLTYFVDARCNELKTVFFTNALGGIDSYSFRVETHFSNIEGNSGYVINNTDYFDKVYEYERVASKEITETFSLSDEVSKEVADWLRELQKSKYVFLFDFETETHIIVDEFSIETNSKENKYSLGVQYHIGDRILYY